MAFIVWKITFLCVTVCKEFTDLLKFTSCFAVAWGFVLVACCLQEERKCISPWTSKVMESFPEIIKIVPYTRLWKDQFCSFYDVQCIRRKVCSDSFVFWLPLIAAKVSYYNRFVTRCCVSAPFAVSCYASWKVGQQCRYCLSEERLRLVRHGGKFLVWDTCNYWALFLMLFCKWVV